MDAQNQEYLQTITQTNDKYEEALGEVAVLREQLHSTRDDLKEYMDLTKSLNHNLIHSNSSQSATTTATMTSSSIHSDISTSKHTTTMSMNNMNNANDEHTVDRDGHSSNTNDVRMGAVSWKDRYERQQVKYEEVLRECEKYRLSYDQLLDQLEVLETMKRDAVKSEKRNKLLSDQIVELSYSNVQLEREINEWNMECMEQRETIQFLQNEHQTLMQNATENVESEREVNLEPSKLTGSKRRLYSFYGAGDGALDQFLVANANGNECESVNMDLKRRLSVQLKDNYSFNSKLVMFANNIEENTTGSSNGSIYGNATDDGRDGDEERSLFTVVQSYENHDEYLREDDQEQTETVQTDQDRAQEQEQEQEESLSELDGSNNRPQTPQSPRTPKSPKSPRSAPPRVHDDSEKKEQSPTKSSGPSPSMSRSKSISKTRSKSVSPNPSVAVLANKSRRETPLDPATSTPGARLKTPSSGSKVRELKPQRTLPRKTTSRHAQRRETDALDEYLHLTASAVKINYPTVIATSKELIEMVRGLPFYQAHDYLNRYMMDRLRWEQIQQNKLLQLKAAAIQSQRDHELAKQGTVTRFFKRLFTAEDESTPQQVVSGNGGGGRHGVINLGAPLSRGENFKLKGVGKARVQSTKSGGTRVHLSSLDLQALTPTNSNANANGKGNATKTTRKRTGNDSLRKKREKQEQRLKTLSMTQTMPSSNINDKNVQKMLQINADYIDSVIQRDSTMNQNTRPLVRRAGSPYSINQHRARRNSRRSVRASPRSPALATSSSQSAGTQTVGWFQWLSGSQSLNPPHSTRHQTTVSAVAEVDEEKEDDDDDDEVHDPYALASSVKRRERRRSNNQRKSRKSKSPKDGRLRERTTASKEAMVVHERSKEVNAGKMNGDINANIKEVLNQQGGDGLVNGGRLTKSDIVPKGSDHEMRIDDADLDEEDMSIVEDLNEIIDNLHDDPTADHDHI